jgi:Recombinase/Recombinase zinc beta ribbon domain
VKRGSCLLVENFDRLSRQPPRAALKQLERILEAGITVVTLQDGKRYTAESLNESLLDLLVVLMTAHRAHEESLVKSKRISASWSNKRQKAREQRKPLTSACPAWISKNEKGSFILDKDKARIVKRIFEESARGMGHDRIAKKFNLEGVPAIAKGKTWQGSYVAKILTNDSVVGTYQPHLLEVLPDGKRRRVPEGDPVAGYYPAAVPTALYLRVRALREGRRVVPPGRPPKDGPNSNGNLFTGLAVCGRCEAPMHYVNKGDGPKGGHYLVCSKAKRGLGVCKRAYRSWNYEKLENIVLSALHREIDWNRLSPRIRENAQSSIEELEEQQATIQFELEKLNRRIENVISEIEQSGVSPALTRRRQQQEQQLTELTENESRIAERLVIEREKLATASASAQEITEAFAEWMTQHAAEKRIASFRRSNGTERQQARERLAGILRENVQEIRLSPKVDRKFGRTIEVVLNPAVSAQRHIKVPFEFLVDLGEKIQEQAMSRLLIPVEKA